MEEKVQRSHDDDSLNFNRLEKELEIAVEADKRYYRENDAKFRAVHQKVETYEEFRDIVRASHLQPINKGDTFTNITFDTKWNSIAEKSSGDKSKVPSEEIKLKEMKIPRDCQEFVREWRRYYKTTQDQYKFLISLGGDTLGKIFRTEVDPLGDILKAFDSEFQDSDCECVINILEQLSSAKRFKLSLSFLSSAEKSTRDSVFSKLSSASSSETVGKRIIALQTTYK